MPDNILGLSFNIGFINLAILVLLQLLTKNTGLLIHNFYIGLVLSSTICLSNFFELSLDIRETIIVSSVLFVLSSIILRLPSTIKPAPIFFSCKFNYYSLLYLNIALCMFFLPKFILNVLVSDTPHSSRIVTVQGLSQLFYCSYFLSMGITVIILSKTLSKIKLTLLEIFSCVLGIISLTAFGGRSFVLFILIGLSVLSTKIYSIRGISILLLCLISGIGMFYFFSPQGDSISESILYRLSLSADIVYYIKDFSDTSSIAAYYPYDIFDLFSNSFNRLLESLGLNIGIHTFMSPGPYIFGGDGQGPLPSFIFDSIFYFGRFYWGYLSLFILVYWFIIRIIFYYKQDNSGWDLFKISFILFPLIHIFQDLAVINAILPVIIIILLLNCINSISQYLYSIKLQRN